MEVMWGCKDKGGGILAEDRGYRGGHRGQLGWGGYKDIEAIILVDEEIEGRGH